MNIETIISYNVKFCTGLPEFMCDTKEVRELEEKYKEAIDALIISMGVMDGIEEYLTGSEKLKPYRQKMIGIIEKACNKPWKEILKE